MNVLVVSQLLSRVFDIMREKNPEMIAGDKKRFVMRPPQVLRVGTRKTSFANFADICRLWVLFLSPLPSAVSLLSFPWHVVFCFPLYSPPPPFILKEFSPSCSCKISTVWFFLKVWMVAKVWCFDGGNFFWSVFRVHKAACSMSLHVSKLVSFKIKLKHLPVSFFYAACSVALVPHFRSHIVMCL